MASQTADLTAALAATGAERIPSAVSDTPVGLRRASQDAEQVSSPASKLSVTVDETAKLDSTDGAENDVPSIVMVPTEDGEVTPPLPNGEKRLHPLFDEDKIASEAAALSKDPEVEAAAEPATKGHPKSLRLLDTMPSDHGYPSPSGGFVPPVTEDGWVLHAPPSGRGIVAPASAPPTITSSVDTSNSTTTNSTIAPANTDNRLSSSSNSSASNHASHDEAYDAKPARPPSLPSSQKTSERIRAAGAGSGNDSRRPSFAESTSQQSGARSNDTALTAARVERHTEETGSSSALRRISSGSSDRSSLLGGKAQSQAISARSSPSTAAPVRRRSSASTGALNPAASAEDAALDALLPPLKIRDYAYTELDPRHVGARDVGLPSVHEQDQSDDEGEMGHAGRLTLGLGRRGGSGGEWGRAGDNDDANDGSDEDDDDDDDTYHDDNFAGDDLVGIDASTSQSGLPLGLYHAAYDFAAESEHELDVKVGQRVRLIGHVDGGWAIVVRVPDGRSDVAADEEQVDKGLVPEAYLEWLAE